MLPLTFGIELECILATLSYGQEDPEPQDSREVHNLTPQIFASSLSELKYVQLKVANRLMIESGVAVIPTGNMPSTPECWTVADDYTIKRDFSSNAYELFPLEFISPPLAFHQGSLDEVRSMCATISNTFRVNCNPTCGFHVHVGNGSGNDEKPFSFEVIRKLIALIWTFEHQIESLHPENRRTHRYCQSLHAISPLGYGTSRQGLERILTTTNLKELRVLTVTSGKQSAYNLCRVDWLASGKTIEFRQHAGTLDPDAVVSWITFVVGLVDTAMRIDEIQLADVLRGVVESEEGGKTVSIFHLMRTLLGCPDAADFYEGKLKSENVASASARF
jgi:hypothetical protein